MYNLYFLKSNLDNRIYIGITKYPKNRHKAHLKYSTKKGHFNGNWIRSTIERGGEINMDVVLQNLSKERAIQLEIGLIKMFRSLNIDITNTAQGGLGFDHTGIPHSEQHKKNIELTQPHKVRIPKDILYDLYINQKLSKKKIGDIYNCGETTVDRRLVEYNIQIRATPNYKVSYKLNKEEIFDLYLNKGVSILQISKKYNIGVSGLKTLFDREGIKIDSNKRYPRKPSDKIPKLKELYEADMIQKDIAKELNITDGHVSYLISKYFGKKINKNIVIIKELYEKGMMQKDMAKILNLDRSSVSHLVNKYIIKTKKRKTNYEELYDLYINKNMSQKNIAELIGYNRSYISELLKSHNLIEIKNIGNLETFEKVLN